MGQKFSKAKICCKGNLGLFTGLDSESDIRELTHHTIQRELTRDRITSFILFCELFSMYESKRVIFHYGWDMQKVGVLFYIPMFQPISNPAELVFGQPISKHFFHQSKKNFLRLPILLSQAKTTYKKQIRMCRPILGQNYKKQNMCINLCSLLACLVFLNFV